MSQIGYGAVLSIDTAGGSSYSALVDVADIDLPDAEANMVPKKTFDQSTRWIAKLPALVDAKQIMFTVHDAGTVYGTYRTLIAAGTRITAKFTWAVGTKNLTFGAYVKGLSPITKIEEIDVCKITLEIDGAITYAAS